MIPCRDDGSRNSRLVSFTVVVVTKGDVILTVDPFQHLYPLWVLNYSPTASSGRRPERKIFSILTNPLNSSLVIGLGHR